MWPSTFLRLVRAVVLAGFVAGCETESQNIPNLTVEEASKLPPDKQPRIFRDPTDPYGDEIHETEGLSRNPEDCVRWGCVDVNAGGS